MIAMWFNGTSGAGGDIDLDLNRSTNPATNCTSLSNCITQASLGTLFQVDGFTGDPDNFWFSSALVAGAFDSSVVAGVGNANLVAGFTAGLGTFYHNGAPIGWQDAVTNAACGDAGNIADGCVQISISGTISGGQGLSNGAFAHSDFDGQKLTLVPAPGVLGLFGLGFMAMGMVSRRKRLTA
jgi:hypothetical protein